VQQPHLGDDRIEQLRRPLLSGSLGPWTLLEVERTHFVANNRGQAPNNVEEQYPCPPFLEFYMDTFLANPGAYVFLTFAALALSAAVAVVAYFWYKLRREEMLADLKRDLAERGMSAEEIRTVIEASPPGTTGVAQDLAALNGCPSVVADAPRQTA